MNEQTRETLSALTDGELTSNETSRAVQRLTQSNDLSDRWGRYHVIGDIIRGEEIRREYHEVAARVRDKLHDEPAILAPPRRLAHWFKPRWVMPAAGSALAASIAVIAILAAPQFINPDPALRPLVTSADNTPSEQVYAAQPGTRWNLSKPDVESKLNAFLVNHQEYAPSRSVKGMLPYVTFVSYDTGR